MQESFEFPGRYYEIIRGDIRDLQVETRFFTSYLPIAGEILDLGCGTGTNLRALSTLGHTGLGVDQSQQFIDYAKNAGSDGIEYVHSRASDFVTDRTFDLVYSIFVTLNYLRRDELVPLLGKVRGWLRPSGRFVVDIGHMLSFVDDYRPYLITHHRAEGILMTRLVGHQVHAHAANWRHEETILVREPDGRLAMYENFFDQMVLTAPELRHLLAQAGFTVLEEYGSFRKEPPSRTGRGSLIFVAGHADR